MLDVQDSGPPSGQFLLAVLRLLLDLLGPWMLLRTKHFATQTVLFVSFRSSVDQTIDRIYKINRFDMPLLNICGTTGNNTPQFAVAFLSGEMEEDYTWAMEKFEEYR